MSIRSTLKSIATFGSSDVRAAAPITVSPSALLPAGPAWQTRRPSWPTYTVETFATTGYAQLATVYRCVNILANAIATAPVRVYRDQDGQPEELPDHPLRTLLRFPNRAQSEAEFLNTIAKIAAVAGFVVCWKVRGGGGRVLELQPLRSDWLIPIPRGDGIDHDWEYTPAGRRAVSTSTPRTSCRGRSSRTRASARAGCRRSPRRCARSASPANWRRS